MKLSSPPYGIDVELLERGDRYTQKAMHFYARERHYREIGLLRIADELHDAAKSFEDMADYVKTTPLLARSES
jgi:hypothetical protein